ncbi:MAG: sigma 54-interacting transcriptional regulator [Thiohalomonadaceae bacterium]|jgi:transcriptional regulator with PAS, ATPase and Fis domain
MSNICAFTPSVNDAFTPSMTGQSPAFCSLVRAAKVVAATDVTVLLLGESGTGKELFAASIHQSSRRAQNTFVAINCAALPEGLAESELFGHRKGAFTGATREHAGRIRAAHGGTLFLDEIGELSLSVQAKLLRFLESSELQSVGETQAERVDVRIIAATHHDLHKRVKQGLFRADLYYRLNVVPLELPALRERTGDIPLLLKTISTQLAAQHNLPVTHYRPRAMKALEQYHWPGNIRELRNFVERMLVLLPGSDIDLENLPHEILRPQLEEHTLFTLPDGGIKLEELEQQMIRQALYRTRGNRSHAARLLGLTRDTLLYRLKKYAIE